MSDLTFDPEKHQYRIAGRVVPSVTQILAAVLPGWQASEWYLQRGRALHHACRLLDEGKLDRSTVHEAIAPRVRAWEKFVADSGCSIVADFIEKPLRSVYGFAGQCDRVIHYQQLPYVLDLKSTIAPQVIVQLGGYSILIREAGYQVSRAVAVELRDDGQYATKWLAQHELKRAEQTFLAALTIHNFMKANGINLKGKNERPSSD